MHPQSSDYKSGALLLSYLTKLCSGWELNPLTFSGFHRTAVPACSTLHCSYWYGFRSCTDLLLSAYIGAAWQSQPRLTRRFAMNELSSYSDLSTVCDRRAGGTWCGTACLALPCLLHFTLYQRSIRQNKEINGKKRQSLIMLFRVSTLYFYLSTL